MHLRDYQSAADVANDEAFKTHKRVLNVLPTGMGKTVVTVTAAAKCEGRTLFVAPLIPLVGQFAKTIRRITGITPDVEQADSWANESWWAKNRFVVGSKQTLFGKSKRYQRFEGIERVVIDEADNQLTKVVAEAIDWLVDHGATVHGVTATPIRNDGKAMSNMYDTCSYEMSIADALPLGWLVGPKAVCIQLESLDLSEVQTKGANGDFKDGELAKVMEDDKVVFEIAEVTAAESGRMKTVVYCAGVQEARKVAHRLIDKHGIKADWICGDERLCDRIKRRSVIESFTGDPDGIQIVCNVGVLTRGWDFPALEHIVMARPTRSLNLFTQIMGRGTRPLEGVVDFEGSTPESRLAAIANSPKPFFKVTDLRDNSLKHKLISTVDVLAGHLGLEVRKKAKQAIEKGGAPKDVSQVVKDAQADFEARERKKLATLEAKAKYKKVEADIFDPNQRAEPVKSKGRVNRMIYGPHKGMALSELSAGYLGSVLRYHKRAPHWLRGAIANELRSRDRANRPTYNGPVEDVNAIFQEAAHGAVTPRPKPAIGSALAEFLKSHQLEVSHANH